MKWEDYKEQEISHLKISLEDWVKTNIECPICGEPVYKNIGCICACYPAKYRYKCSKCDWTDTWF